MCQLKENEVSYTIYKYMPMETETENKKHRHQNSSRTHTSRKLLNQYADDRFLVLGNLQHFICQDMGILHFFFFGQRDARTTTMAAVLLHLFLLRALAARAVADASRGRGRGSLADGFGAAWNGAVGEGGGGVQT